MATTLQSDRGNIHSATSITIVPKGRLETGVYTTDLIVTEERNGRDGQEITILHELTLFHDPAKLSAQIVERDEWLAVPTPNEVLSHTEAESIRGSFEHVLACFEVAYKVAASHKRAGTPYRLDCSAHIDLRASLQALFSDLYESDCGRFVRLSCELEGEYENSFFLTGLYEDALRLAAKVEDDLFHLRNHLLGAFRDVTGETL